MSQSQFGILFDNDGVLIDSGEYHWKSWKILQKEYPSFKMTHAEFMETFGQRNESIFTRFCPDASADLVKEMGERKEELFREDCGSKLVLLDGMEEFLKSVENENIPHIIASSGPIVNLTFFLKSTVIGKYFTLFASGEEVPKGKPAPDVFLLAAERIGIPPERCVVLEDSPAGLKAGKAAGCKVIALATTHSRNELSDYDIIVSSPRDLNLGSVVSLFS